jgi:putative transposase
MIRKADYQELRGKLSGNAFWSPSYCAISSGDAPQQTIAEYVRNQRDPQRPERGQHRSP